MNYYKLIKSGGGYDNPGNSDYTFEVGKIYPGNFDKANLTVEKYANGGLSTWWQVVTEEEYNFQEGFILPERWCVKDCEIVSKYAAEKQDCSKSISFDRYYCEEPDDYFFLELKDAKERGYIRITLAQFKKYVLKKSVMEEVEEVLPEKWCIKTTPSTRREVGDFLTSKGYSSRLSSDYYCHYPFINGGSAWSIIKDGYTEITFDQFQRLVLKKQSKVKQPKAVAVKKVKSTTPERISFYVRYTPEFTEDLYNKLLTWGTTHVDATGTIRGWKDSYQGLISEGFFLFDNWGLNKSSYIFPLKESYGVDNNTQNCKEEYSIKQVKELINYVEPIKETIMKSKAMTFKITSKSKALLEAMWKELLTVGYNGKECQNEFTVITHNKNADGIKSKEDFIELWDDIMYLGGDSFDKTFNLPEQYTEALEFAKAQLNPALWSIEPEIKVGSYVITGGYSRDYDGKVLKINMISGGKYCYFDCEEGGCNFGINHVVRLATPEEVKKYEDNLLLEEANKRYPIGTKCRCNFSGFNETFIRVSPLKLYSGSKISASGEPWVYAYGKWAEIVPNTIDIKGYTCEFTSDSVKFGCQTFDKQTTLDLVRLLDLGVITSAYESQLREVAKHFSN